MKLKEVKVGDKFVGKLLVASIQNGVAQNGKPFLTVVVQDDTKQISCKLWDVKQDVNDMLKSGSVYDFTIEFVNYKGSVQGKILSVEPTTQDDIKDYLISSPIDYNELHDFISECVNSIKNDTLARVVCALLKYYGNDFYEYQAAAKIHHAYVGGLATHTYEMLKLGVEVCKIFKEVNYDYLISGIVIHDLGKIEEYEKPTISEFSTEGKLLGHISILDANILSIAKELGVENTEEVMVLRHMILSHHGKREFGSPVLPATLEAFVLNMIDDLDTKINVVAKELESIEEGNFTGKVFSLNETSLYKHK